ncbi:hypothetical protein GGF39_002456 [Coemansia sp. RSA 1721]|nr:hypothetical protein GGF39_002456 [Coemansia sp. RSA 1721]
MSGIPNNTSASSINEEEYIPEYLNNAEQQQQQQYQENDNNGTPGLLTSATILYLMFSAGLYMTMDAVIYIPIANELNALSRAEWIVSGYMITVTALQPIYGKLSDILGRVPAMGFGLLMLLIGSVIAATAQSMDVLIASRAIQGIGSAGILSMANVLIADLYPERARARFMGIASGVWSVAASGSAVLGGAITQLSSWRVAYWVNVPICVTAAAAVAWTIRVPLPSGTLKEKVRKIDFGGSAISLASMLLILLALSWGGRDYAWGSAAVLCCLVFGIVLAFLFFVYESKIPAEPIVPLRVLRTRNVALSFIGHLFFGAITYAPLIFIPQWALLVQNTTPITSGLYVLPFSLSELVAVVAVGAWVTHIGRYRESVWVGSLLMVSGLTPLVMLDQNHAIGRVVGFQIIAGVGFGMCIQTLLLTAQVSCDDQDLASVTALCLFMRSLGAVLVVAVLSSVNGNTLQTEFARITMQYPGYADEIARVRENQSLIHKLELPQELVDLLISGFMKGMRATFIALIPFSTLFVVSVAGIKHVPLRKTKKTTIQ